MCPHCHFPAALDHPDGDRAGTRAREVPRADGGAALHPSGRRAPASRIPGGKRDPWGSLRIPQTILSLPTAAAPRLPPAPLCHKDVFSITATSVPPVILLPLCPIFPPATLQPEGKPAQGPWHRAWGAGGCLHQIQEHTSKIRQESRTLGRTFFPGTSETWREHNQGNLEPPSPFSPVLAALPGEEAGDGTVTL